MVIFRCDMLILLGPLALVMLLGKEVHRRHSFPHTVPSDQLLVNSSNWSYGLRCCIARHHLGRLVFLEKVTSAL